jgi:hypothetical protein
MFRPHPSVGASPSSDAAGNTYVWIGTTGSAWDAPADWNDTTTGTTGISAPGRGDTASIAGGEGNQTLTVTGGGAAASLSVTNQVSLLGDYRFDALHVTGFASTLEVGSPDAGAPTTVRVSTLQMSGPGGFATGLDVTQSQLFVSGRLSLQGTLAVTVGADVRIGSLVMTDPGALSGCYVSVDSTSTLEIGTAGGAAAGYITVDAGATLSGSGGLDAPVVNNGVIAANGELVLSDDVTGSGELKIAARSDMIVAAAVSGQTIDFAGPESRLDVTGFSTVLNGPGWLAPGTTITGFVAGDIIAFRDAIISASLTSIPGGESLRLTDADEQVEQLTLVGATDATRYLLLTVEGGTLVLAVPTDSGKGRPSAGTARRDAYVWSGGVGSNWKSAGNWQDTTRSGTASIAPGRHDDVTITSLDYSPTVITGVGEADTLTLTPTADGFTSSTLLLDGRFAVHRLTGVGELIEVGAASVITADIVDASSLGLAFEGGVLRAGYAQGGQWSLQDAAHVQVAHAQSLFAVVLDATSSFEVGTAGHAAVGKFTVDAGARIAGSWYINADVIDNGTMRANALAATIRGSLTGHGTVVIDSSDTLTVGYGISGVTIDFAGRDATLAIGNPEPTGFTIAGFAPGDYLVFPDELYAPAALHAVYTASSAGEGTLSLVDQNGSVEGRIKLLGDYTGDTFLLSHSPNTDGEASVTVLPPAVQRGMAPIGTTIPDTFYFDVIRVGSWDDAANWYQDVQGAAPSAPGLDDDVNIGTSNDLFPQELLGVGSANTITANGAVVLDGRFSATELIGSTVAVAGKGSMLTIGTLEGKFDNYIYSLQLTLSGGTVDVTGSAQIGNLFLSHDATMTAGSLTLNGSIDVDAQSSLVVGTLTGIAAGGTVTVASDGTLSGYGTIAAALHDDGSIVSYGLVVDGAVTGTGTLAIDDDGLTLSGAAASKIAISLSGSGVPVFLDDPAAMHATIAGFAASDTIALGGIVDATQAIYSYAGNDFGQLALTNAGGTTLDILSLAGDYRGATFALTTDTGYGQEITVAGHTV